MVAPDYGQADSATEAVADTVRLPSRTVPFDPEDRLMRWTSLADLDRRLAGTDFHVVHVQTPFAAHYAGLRLARARGIPCIATYHTHFEEYLFHYIRFLPKSALRYVLARRLHPDRGFAWLTVIVAGTGSWLLALSRLGDQTGLIMLARKGLFSSRGPPSTIMLRLLPSALMVSN